MEIGNWVHRKESGTKWHLVESIVADAAITRCGKRMEPTIKGGAELETSPVMPLTRVINQPQLCKPCNHDA